MSNIILVIWLHFVGDFILQTDKMALNKATSNKWLALHVVAYSTPFLWFGWRYALVNCAAHLVTDFFTSRGTKWANAQGRRGLFFKIIGFDQAVHMTCLIATLGWL